MKSLPIKARLDELREHLAETDHPLNEDIHWLIGISEAMILIAELSSTAVPDFMDYDS